MTELTDLERGLIVGLIIGEGHIGGDGRYPFVTVKMHIRHERLLRWIHSRFPRSKLYGPYHYEGRHTFQWMVRGKALVFDLMPILEATLSRDLDEKSWRCLIAMKSRYRGYLARVELRGD